MSGATGKPLLQNQPPRANGKGQNKCVVLRHEMETGSTMTSPLQLWKCPNHTGHHLHTGKEELGGRRENRTQTEAQWATQELEVASGNAFQFLLSLTAELTLATGAQTRQL